jgi:hypothetical protein
MMLTVCDVANRSFLMVRGVKATPARLHGEMPNPAPPMHLIRSDMFTGGRVGSF